MNDIFLGRLQIRFFRRVSYNLPPEPVAPTEENTAAAAESAAQKEKEELKKKRRPTLLTGYGGVAGTPALSSATLGGNTKLGQ
jgi:hypothetical protein